MRPLVGISSYGRAGERLSFSLPCDYVDVVRAVGGVPIVLPAVEGEIPEVLDVVEALVFPGGGDVHPEHYEGEEHEKTYGVSRERDGFELALLRTALARPDLPVLCVCRGLQVLNVALGGDLVPHVPDLYGEGVVHRATGLKPVPHEVRVDPESRLAAILGTTSLPVQSIHHQAVGRLGEGLRAVAWSADGVVEAVESDAHPLLLAVQWHPELSAREDVRHRRLFETLVARGSSRSAPAVAAATK